MWSVKKSEIIFRSIPVIRVVVTSGWFVFCSLATSSGANEKGTAISLSMKTKTSPRDFATPRFRAFAGPCAHPESLSSRRAVAGKPPTIASSEGCNRLRSNETITSWSRGSDSDNVPTSSTTIGLISRHGIMNETLLKIPALPIILPAHSPTARRNSLAFAHPSSFVSCAGYLEKTVRNFEMHSVSGKWLHQKWFEAFR